MKIMPLLGYIRLWQKAVFFIDAEGCPIGKWSRRIVGKGLDHCPQKIRVPEIVGIDGSHQGPCTSGDSPVPRGCKATIGLIDHPEAPVAFEERSNDILNIVRRTVVHNNNFEVTKPLGLD